MSSKETVSSFSQRLNEALNEGGENLSEGGGKSVPGESSTRKQAASRKFGPGPYCVEDFNELGGFLCGGLLQNASTALGRRACTELRIDCTVKSHETKAPFPDQMEAVPTAKFWLLQGAVKSRTVITLDHVWSCADISESVIDNLTDPPSSVGEWVLLLNGLAAEKNVSSSEANSFAARVKSYPLAMTPKSKLVRYAPMASSTPDSWEGFVDMDSMLVGLDITSSSATVTKRIRETLPVVVSNVSVVHAAVERVSDNFKSFTESASNDLNQHEGLLLQLRAEVGTRPRDMGASELWSHVESLSENVDVCLSRTETESVKRTVDPLINSALDKTLNDIVTMVKPSYLLTKRFSTRPDSTPGDLLESRLHLLETGRGFPSHPPPHPNTVPATTDLTALQLAVAALTLRVEGQERDIASLTATKLTQETKLSQLESAMMTQTVKCGEESFTSAFAARAFALNQNIESMPTCAIDFISLLQVAHHDVSDTAQAVQEGANAIKAGYSNLLESTVASSYQIHVPTFWAGTSKGLGVSATGLFPLPALKSYDAWDDKSTICLRVYLEEAVTRSVESLKATLSDSYLGVKMISLCKHMIDSAVMGVTKLFMFMDRFYFELVNTYHTDEKESWHLVSRIVKQYLGDLYAVRSVARFSSFSSQGKAKVGSLYLWAALQAHRITVSYLAAEFRHHPNVAPVITIHLYSHRVPLSIFERRATKWETELKKLGDAVRTAVTTAGQALKKSSNG